MIGRDKENTQRLLAIIVIVAMLAVMGIHPSVIVFFAVVTYFIWRAVQRSEHQETGRIFEFYISANDILSDYNRHWYGFEFVEVIERGERVLHSMQDPPPLIYFAMGALYNRAGNHAAAVEHLAYLLENEHSSEVTRMAPSPELRRYVQILRKIEREPAGAPRTVAAIRSLDRMRSNSASDMLSTSRQFLNLNPGQPALRGTALHGELAFNQSPPSCDPGDKATVNRHSKSHNPPPSITEVLRDVYEEEKKTA